jgi:hypothetical protein
MSETGGWEVGEGPYAVLTTLVSLNIAHPTGFIRRTGVR